MSAFYPPGGGYDPQGRVPRAPGSARPPEPPVNVWQAPGDTGPGAFMAGGAGPYAYVAPGQPGPYGHQPPPGWPAYPVVAAKNPTLSLLASMVLPGLGQFVNGDTNRGVAFLVGFLASFAAVFVMVGLLALPAVVIWSMVDAYRGAQRWNAERGIVS